MFTEDEIIDEIRRNPYTRPYVIDETHVDENGDKWFIISAVVVSLDNWLSEQCDSSEGKCGRAPLNPKWDRFPRYNIHESLMSFITLRWS